MSKIFIEESTLTAIGDAIREKTGGTELIPPLDMATQIKGITTTTDDCNGLHIPEEALTLTGDLSDRFYGNGWNWFIEEFGDKITTKDITSVSTCFQMSNLLEEIPFDLNFKEGNNVGANYLFGSCTKLKSIGKLVNFSPMNMPSTFMGCQYLRYLPEFVNADFTYAHDYKSFMVGNFCANCCSLRSVPEELLKEIYSSEHTSSTYSQFSNMFNYCYSLDEIKGVSPRSGTLTSNMFGNVSSGTFANCYRVKEIIFDMQEDGTPYKANWKSQTIDLRTVGWAHTSGNVVGFNSGITRATEVTNDEQYHALKNNSDWWSIYQKYCRYNHNSAVNTINSLPDTSEYLATAGGTNTITFLTGGGSSTDEGAQDTLTAEEIAVATAKGWTVAFGTR